MAQKTWWHLAAQRRIPAEYDIVSSKLLYYPGRGSEVRTPVAEWMLGHQASSGVAHIDWEAFSDPRRLTYRSYVRARSVQEAAQNELLANPATDDDCRCALASEDWRRLAETVFAPMRYPCHGMMMLSAFAGHMAPGGKVVICCALQAADEVRRVDRLAQYLALLVRNDPAIAVNAKGHWQNHACWQPMRKLIEQLLTVQDWFECLVALNLVLKPLAEDVMLRALAAAARDAGDDTVRRTLESFAADAGWHKAWAAEAARVALAQDAKLADLIQSHVSKWLPVAREAATALESHMRGAATPDDERLRTYYEVFLRDVGLEARPAPAPDESLA